MDEPDTLTADPVDQSGWRGLRLLQAAMDSDIARLYAERNIDGLKPSHTMALIRLDHRGPMTITELADSVQVTHSAMSQKVAALRRAGLVRSVAGSDARTKRILLTAKAKRILGFLEAEWRATENAVAGIEAEIPYPLSQVVSDIAEVLQRKSFHDRIVEGLAADN
ncbi:MAG: MarR family transcriptional regulator [Actinomycetota bacterium]|nr:MarR family transcriptional regulator [Actinomycetota bacterium]